MTLAEAQEHLAGVVETTHGLYSPGWYLAWDVGNEKAILDGEFSADDLEAIAVYMRNVKETK